MRLTTCSCVLWDKYWVSMITVSATFVRQSIAAYMCELTIDWYIVACCCVYRHNEHVRTGKSVIESIDSKWQCSGVLSA